MTDYDSWSTPAPWHLDADGLVLPHWRPEPPEPSTPPLPWATMTSDDTKPNQTSHEIWAAGHPGVPAPDWLKEPASITMHLDMDQAKTVVNILLGRELFQVAERQSDDPAWPHDRKGIADLIELEVLDTYYFATLDNEEPGCTCGRCLVHGTAIDICCGHDPRCPTVAGSDKLVEITVSVTEDTFAWLEADAAAKDGPLDMPGGIGTYIGRAHRDT